MARHEKRGGLEGHTNFRTTEKGDRRNGVLDLLSDSQLCGSPLERESSIPSFQLSYRLKLGERNRNGFTSGTMLNRRLHLDPAVEHPYV